MKQNIAIGIAAVGIAIFCLSILGMVGMWIALGAWALSGALVLVSLLFIRGMGWVFDNLPKDRN